jgi:hypothetical protein
MARLRTRAKRSVLLAIALALLALLLEMNRFLPGTWPGGDGGGVRVSSETGERSDLAPRKKEDPDPPQDPATVVPPEAPPPLWPPKTGIPIELRSADGSLETDWRLGIGEGGSEDGEPNADGSFRARDRRILEQGFRIRIAGRLLRQREGLQEPASRWAVFRPRADLPEQRQPAPIDLRVVDAVTGAPLPDTLVETGAMGSTKALRTGADGQVELKNPQRTGLVRATVRREGYDPQTLTLSPRNMEAPEVALDPRAQVPLQIIGPSGEEPTISEGYVLRPDGTEILRFRGARPTLDLRAADRKDAWLEIHVVVDPERRIEFPFRTPLAGVGATLQVPAHRVLPVSVRDPQGRAVSDVRISAHYGSAGLDPAEGEPQHKDAESLTDARGRAEIAVPVTSPYRVLVQPPLGAPIARRFQRGDGTAPLEIITEPGIQMPIAVRGADGAPLVGAQVVARASVMDTRVVRSARTDARGRAQLGPLPEGPVEVFAGAPGHGWNATVEAASSAMGTVSLRLERGYAFTIVVADPFGVPLEGVRAEVTPADGGRPLVASPEPAPRSSDAAGRLRLPDLPARTYDVALSRAGYGVETLRGITPGAVTYFATLVRSK